MDSSNRHERRPHVTLAAPISEATIAQIDAALRDFEVEHHVDERTWTEAFEDADHRVVESPEFFRAAALYALHHRAHDDTHFLAVA